MTTPGKLCPELAIVRGDTEIINFTVGTDTNTPNNITGFTFAMQLRTTPDAVSPAATLTCVVTDGVNGKVTCTLAAADSATLTGNASYYYDLQQTDLSGNKTTLISGITQPIIPDVTRP